MNEQDLLNKKIGDLKFKEIPMASDDTQYAHHGDFGFITVLERMTGYGFKDVETGFRDPEGKFWLAAGDFSILRFSELTVEEAINKIKDNANICKGD